MPGIEDFRKRAKQMTEKARHHGHAEKAEKKARSAENDLESRAERAKLRDAEEAPEPQPEGTEELTQRGEDEV